MSSRVNRPHKIKVALIGCGRISLSHLRAIDYHKNDIELVAICDTNRIRLREFKNILLSKHPALKLDNLLIYDNYTLLINSIRQGNISVDLVVLLTPSGMHCEQTIMAAEVGVNICTEKPMATNWEDGLAMVKACDSASVELFVVKQNRFNPTVALLKKQLLDNRFGKLALVSSNVFWQRPQSYYDQDEWRGTWKFDGGALMNQASHYVDLLEWLIGPVETVCAFSSTRGRKIEAEDTIVLQLRWLNGTIGTMSVTMLTYPKNLEGSITVLGENGTVRIGGTALNHIDNWIFDNESEDDLKATKSDYDTTNVYGLGHVPYYGNMVRVLYGEEPAMCNGREGLKSLEIILAAYKSSATGAAVRLPLSQGDK